MFQKKQKPPLIFISLLLLFICFSYAFALEIKYPSAGGQGLSEKPTFPEYVKYIFNFSIIIAGIIAFGVLVFSGIKILTSPDQPETIKDARTKITGAFLGIVILLSSYLLLTTINPQLSILTLKPVEPVSGVYLTDDKGKEHYVADSSSNLGFTATTIKFISSPEELIAVYDASEKKTENTGTGSGGSFSGKSIYFLWNRPGVYLYPKTNFEGRPIYINSSVSSLSSYNFDDKAQSIQFKNKKEENLVYGLALFTGNDFRGKCNYILGKDVNNLSLPNSTYIEFNNPLGSQISSLVISNIKDKAESGTVTFYDDIDCKGNKKTYNISEMRYFYDLSPTAQQDTNFETPTNPPKSLYENILSFEINGNFGVILNTEPYLKGKCQFFSKPSGTTCIPTLVGEYVYDPIPINPPPPLPKRDKVRSIIIIPLAQ